jgi:aminoglycoside 6'-N-acetyltransferase
MAELGEKPSRAMPRADGLPREAGPVLLRRLAVVDFAAFQAYRQDPVVARYQGWSPMPDAEALEFIREMAVAALFARGSWVQLAIARSADNALVGDLGLFLAEDGGHAELGFTIAPSAQRRGLGTAAVRGAIGLLFEQTPARKVLGITDARNTPSARLLERVGMTRVEQRQTVFRNEECTEWVYAIEK